MDITREKVEKLQKTTLKIHKILLALTFILIPTFLIIGYFTGQFTNTRNILQLIPFVSSPFLALLVYVETKRTSKNTDPEVIKRRLEKWLPIRVPTVLGIVLIFVGEAVIILLDPRNEENLLAAMLFGMFSGSLLFLFIRRATR